MPQRIRFAEENGTEAPTTVHIYSSVQAGEIWLTGYAREGVAKLSVPTRIPMI